MDEWNYLLDKALCIEEKIEEPIDAQPGPSSSSSSSVAIGCCHKLRAEKELEHIIKQKTELEDKAKRLIEIEEQYPQLVEIAIGAMSQPSTSSVAIDKKDWDKYLRL